MITDGMAAAVDKQSEKCDIEFVTLWPGFSSRRPSYSPDEYREHVLIALEHGVDPWPPKSPQEYLIIEELSPRLAKEWRPKEYERELLGLPEDYGEPAELLSRADRRAIIRTLHEDREFGAALWEAIRGAGA